MGGADDGAVAARDMQLWPRQKTIADTARVLSRIMLI